LVVIVLRKLAAGVAMVFGNSITDYAVKQVLRTAARWLTTPDDLHVLTISLNVQASPAEVLFELVINPELRVAAARSIQKWSFATGTFAIPERLEPGQQDLLPTSLPASFVEELEAHLPTAKDTPLWVKFGPVAGYLRLVAWDSLLQTALKRPIVRLIDLESPPPRELATTLDIVLCASEPRAKSEFAESDALVTITRSILAANPREKVHLHVFADADKYDELNARLSEFGEQVHMYPPLPTDLTPERSRPLPAEITNPWLRWIALSLTRPVDVVHFVCHGYLTEEQGWIALAETPTKNIDQERSRFVGGGELNPFLVQVGAWSMALSSPPGNFSSTGLRLLINRMCEEGCRSALLHDLAVDRDCAQLIEAYTFLYRPGADFVPNCDGFSIYCHPSLVKVGTVANTIVRSVAKALPGQFGYTLPEDFTNALATGIDESLRKLQEQGDGPPPWLATTQRYVEQSKLELRRLERVASGSAQERQQIDQAKAMLAAIERTVVGFADPSGGHS
jgi:hypothetical protein